MPVHTKRHRTLGSSTRAPVAPQHGGNTCLYPPSMHGGRLGSGAQGSTSIPDVLDLTLQLHLSQHMQKTHGLVSSQLGQGLACFLESAWMRADLWCISGGCVWKRSRFSLHLPRFDETVGRTDHDVTSPNTKILQYGVPGFP